MPRQLADMCQAELAKHDFEIVVKEQHYSWVGSWHAGSIFKKEIKS
jgi:hypothetical protein